MKPIDMVLHCPVCGTQHIDAPEICSCGVNSNGYCNCGVHKLWRNPPHKSHLCSFCHYIWRPADVSTTGVSEISTKGKNDSGPADNWLPKTVVVAPSVPREEPRTRHEIQCTSHYLINSPCDCLYGKVAKVFGALRRTGEDV